ncbi:helix-turn-helix domain-containing protein [Amycolatopsis azurea]|uniref:helix-turn-helix domain-containing protein n=1 Tax=Amycolatopsis azurea TaxID=36819 RepID=UPI003803FB59
MLTTTEFRTDDLPAREREDALFGLLGEKAIIEFRGPRGPGFRFAQRLLSTGAISMGAAHGMAPSMLLRRTPELVRRYDPEVLHLAFSTDHRSIGIRKDEVVLRPRDWSIVDSRLPYDIPVGEGQRGETWIAFPYAVLPVRRSRIERLVGRSLCGESGYGALLAQVLTQIVSDAGSYRPEDAPQLETTVSDLVTAFLCRALDGGRSEPAESRRRNLILRIRAFVRQNLHDPGLSPGSIADAHHISRSHLHVLFKDQEETVAAWIRRQRLERACRDLADPAMLDTPVHAIAARWGFPRAADFTRVFRTARGVTPREYRRQARDNPEA